MRGAGRVGDGAAHDAAIRPAQQLAEDSRQMVEVANRDFHEFERPRGVVGDEGSIRADQLREPAEWGAQDRDGVGH